MDNLSDVVLEHKRWRRREAQEIARNLPPGAAERAGHAIALSVASMPEYHAAQTVMLFLSMANEPATGELVEKAINDGKRVCIPLCIDTKEHIMEAREYKGHEQLVKGAYGILEPSKDSIRESPSEIDLAIIPCVACDYKCNRLGHGAGYYDRWLDGTTFPKASVCFDSLVLDSELPTDEYDQAMDYIITEKRIIAKQ